MFRKRKYVVKKEKDASGSDTNDSKATGLGNWVRSLFGKGNSSSSEGTEGSQINPSSTSQPTYGSFTK